jgi:hypothetical protein
MSYREDEIEPYDRHLLHEIAVHMVFPSPMQILLDTIGKPFDRVMAALENRKSKLGGKISGGIDHGVRRAINKSVILGGKIMRDRTVVKRYRKAGYPLTTYRQVRELSLEARDRIAGTFNIGSALLVTTEGAVLGAAASLAEMAPGAQVVIPALIATDVAASMTLLSRHLVQLGSAYGFSVRQNRANVAHVLGAMVPQQLSYDEGFVPIKVSVMSAAKEAGEFAARVGLRAGEVGFKGAMDQLAKEAPQLIKLINIVVEKLGVRVSQKVFGLLVPMVGGAVNGGINLAFQRTGQRTGKDYFRLLILAEKYGDDTIKRVLDQEIEELRRSGKQRKRLTPRILDQRGDPARSDQG